MRRLVIGVCLAGLAPSAQAFDKDMDRLRIQIAGLEAQVADLRRLNEDTLRELRRLNEALAAQNDLLKKTAQDQKLGDESVQVTLREMAERLAEVRERFQAFLPAGPAAAAPSAALASAATSGAVPASAAPGASAPGSAPVSGSAPPRELYSQAYADYARGNYDIAIQGFQEYIKNYPNTDFTDNAQYWIGESLYGKQRYPDAIEAWNLLLRDYPASDKLPDARIKKGMALEKLGRRSQALLEYRYVVDHYPNSQAARIAKERLNPQ